MTDCEPHGFRRLCKERTHEPKCHSIRDDDDGGPPDGRGQAKIDYCEITESLQHKQDEAKTRLQELKHSSDEAWVDIKKGVDHAWTEVKTAFHSVASKFN